MSFIWKNIFHKYVFVISLKNIFREIVLIWDINHLINYNLILVQIMFGANRYGAITYTNIDLYL